MCCLIAIMVLLGPRLAAVVWWFVDTNRWSAAFSSLWWPLLGVLFLPWTLLAYVAVSPGGFVGFDWFWVVLGFIFDLGSYSGGSQKKRWL